MKKKYILYFDLIGSRSVRRRTEYQKKLSQAIETLNATYHKDLYVPIEIIKGIDEMEIVLKKPSNLLAILFDVIAYMHPHCYRIVGVKGKIDILSKKASQLDGSALHQIPPTLDFLKKNNFYFQMVSEDVALNAVLNGAIPLLCQHWYGLTPAQMDIYKAIRQGITQKEYAQSQHLSQQYISKVVTTTAVKQHLWVENQIHHYLKSIAV